MKQTIFWAYCFFLFTFVLFSYLFMEANLPFLNTFYTGIATQQRSTVTIGYTLFICLFVFYYWWIVFREKVLVLDYVKRLIIAAIIILFFAYPAMLSYDIFNYVMTAKVAFFYHENPYIVMPIEFLGDSYLAFTRATNKIALYGPTWLLFTGIPHVLGAGNIVSTIFSFKFVVTLFYIATIGIIWKLTKSTYSVGLFALSPLVLIETLVSSHNDIVMMFFALFAFYLLKKTKILLAIISFIIAIGIKYATVALLPVFLYAVFMSWQKKKVMWDRVYITATLSMFLPFFAAPLREEIYPWYVIWMLSFVVLVPQYRFWLLLITTLSISTLFQYVPVLFTGNYFGSTPLIKSIVTFAPLACLLLLWPILQRRTK